MVGCCSRPENRLNVFGSQPITFPHNTELKRGNLRGSATIYSLSLCVGGLTTSNKGYVGFEYQVRDNVLSH